MECNSWGKMPGWFAGSQLAAQEASGVMEKMVEGESDL